MEQIKYEVTEKHLCKTQCPFCTTGEWSKVGAYECTTRCPAFVRQDKEAQVVVCDPWKVPYARFVWSDVMKERYPDLGKDNEAPKDTREKRTAYFEADTVVEGFYKACEHLAAHIHTVGSDRTKFTTSDMTASKNRVETENDAHEVFFYQIRTRTGFYQCRQDSLWLMAAAMESVEGVPTAKRRVFEIKTEKGQDADVILRLGFDMDKEVQRIRECLSTDDLRPLLKHPVIETASGVMVGSDGHILAAHKLAGYEQDLQGGLPVKFEGMLSVPREVCRMKGRVTIEAVEGTWEESVEDGNGNTETKEVCGIIVTATDAGGRQAVVKSHARFPRWRSVVPKEIGPAVSIDRKQMSDGVKRVRPQLNNASELMKVESSKGDGAVRLSGEDCDFSTSGCVTVPLAGASPCDMAVGLKAPSVLSIMAFGVKTMHYDNADHPVLFVGDNTMAILMPMITDDFKSSPRPARNLMEKFDIGAWVDKPIAKIQDKKPQAKRKPKPAAKVVMKATAKAEPTLAERLRAALLERLAA